MKSQQRKMMCQKIDIIDPICLIVRPKWAWWKKKIHKEKGPAGVASRRKIWARKVVQKEKTGARFLVQKEKTKKVIARRKMSSFNTKVCIWFGTNADLTDVVPNHDILGPKNRHLFDLQISDNRWFCEAKSSINKKLENENKRLFGPKMSWFGTTSVKSAFVPNHIQTLVLKLDILRREKENFKNQIWWRCAPPWGSWNYPQGGLYTPPSF